MNFRKIFGNVQKHFLQYVFCQIRIAHNFVSGMVDQPFVGIIWKKYVFPIYMAYNGKGRKDALSMKF